MGIVTGDGWEIVLKTSEHLLPKAQLLKCLRRRKKNQFLWEGRDVGMIFFLFFFLQFYHGCHNVFHVTAVFGRRGQECTCFLGISAWQLSLVRVARSISVRDMC